MEKAERAEKLREAERERVREMYQNKCKVEIIPAGTDIKNGENSVKQVALIHKPVQELYINISLI